MVKINNRSMPRISLEISLQFTCIVGLNRVKTEDSGKTDGVIIFEPPQTEQEQLKAADSRVIIQKVEKVTYDVSSLLFSPGKSTSSLPEATTSKANVKQNDAIPEKDVAIDQGSSEKPNGMTTVSLVTTKYPENEFNTKVPLKVVQIIKQPKPKPNLTKRVHRIQTFRPSQVPPPKVAQPEVKTEPVVPQPVIIKKEEPEVKKIIVKAAKSDSGSDCYGFDVDSDDPTIKTSNYYDFLKKEDAVPNGASTSGIKTGNKSESAVAIRSPLKSSSPSKRMTRNTSMLRGKEIATKTEVAPKIKSPEKQPKAETKSSDNKPAKPVSNSWQNDIFAVIGTSRLKEIDEMLKNIPNIIDGSFNPIEMENVELKLIIKHLMRKLKVESITDTLKPGDSQQTFSSGGLSFNFNFNVRTNIMNITFQIRQTMKVEAISVAAHSVTTPWTADLLQTWILRRLKTKVLETTAKHRVRHHKSSSRSTEKHQKIFRSAKCHR